MPCIDTKHLSALVGVSLIAGCSAPVPPPPAAPVAPPAVVAPLRPAPTVQGATAVPQPVRLAAPGVVRNWNEVRLQAARRLVAAHPQTTYMGEVPEPLLAIPVLEIELNADGSVRRVNVQRRPGQATDTVQLAVDAVYRAGPYGDVSHLPRPWRFTEVFLFRDDRRFKPRTLDR